MAGEQAERSPEGIDERLAFLSDAGIVTTVDQASLGSPESGYGAPWLKLGRQIGRENRRLDNYGVLDDRVSIELVAEIDAKITSGRPVYVNCTHGVGRARMVIGVWLRRSAATVSKAGCVGYLRRGRA